MFIELHSRSAFSFLEGASLPEDLIATCADLNMPAMALLDRDGVYGAPRFYMAAKKAKIKAHLGAEVTSEICQIHRLKIEDLNPGIPINLQSESQSVILSAFPSSSLPAPATRTSAA